MTATSQDSVLAAIKEMTAASPQPQALERPLNGANAAGELVKLGSCEQKHAVVDDRIDHADQAEGDALKVSARSRQPAASLARAER